MKILYVYNDYGGRRKIYGEIMKEFGHDVKYMEALHKRESDIIKLDKIRNINPDIIFVRTPYYVSHKGISDDTMDYIKSKKIPLVLYSTIIPQVPYTEQLNIWEKFDVLFIINKELCNFLQKNKLNAHYIPLAFHPSQYYKTISNKKYDISFMGSALKRCKDKRSKYLKELVLKGYRSYIAGRFFDNKIPGHNIEIFRGHDIQRTIYSKTKINLDLPFIDGCSFYKNKYHFKNRFFEIPATGNFLMSIRCPEFLDIFPEDTIGYYDDNKESLKENIKKYLRDDVIRNKMAKKAYNLVHEKHTFKHRFEKILKILQKSM